MNRDLLRRVSGSVVGAILFAQVACLLSEPPPPISCPDGEVVPVLARSLGNQTGIEVEEGQTVSISADPYGQWSLGIGAPMGADGVFSPEPFVSKVPGARFGALVVWIDECPEEALLVGLGAQVVAPCGGEIVLAANDNFDPGCLLSSPFLGCHHDNKGSIDVCVEVGAVDGAGTPGGCDVFYQDFGEGVAVEAGEEDERWLLDGVDWWTPGRDVPPRI